MTPLGQALAVASKRSKVYRIVFRLVLYLKGVAPLVATVRWAPLASVKMQVTSVMAAQAHVQTQDLQAPAAYCLDAGRNLTIELL